MVQRAKFSTQKSYPAEIVVLGSRALQRTGEAGSPVQLGAVRLDRRTLEETASFTSLIRPENIDEVEGKSLRGTGISLDQLRDAPAPDEVVDGFEEAIFSSGESRPRSRDRVLLAAADSCTALGHLQRLLERAGMDRGRYGDLTLDLGSLALQAQGVMGLRTPSRSNDLDTQLAAFGLPRPAKRDALEEARLTAEVFRRYQQIGTERERAFEVAALDPDLLALVRDIEGKPNIKVALQEFIQQRSGEPRTLRERLLRFVTRRRAKAEAKAAGSATPGPAPTQPATPRREGGPGGPRSGTRQLTGRAARRRAAESGHEPRV
jgi:DNA polymerase III epsilon subunit-like protein